MTDLQEMLATPVTELEHYGIKGMKWGVRRKNPSGSSSGKLAPLKRKKPQPPQKTQKPEGKKFTDRLVPVKKDKSAPIQKKEITIKAEKPVKKDKPLKDLTDAELRERIARIELEQRYSQLTAPRNEKRKSEGRKAAERVLINLAANTAQQYGQHVINKGLRSIDPSYKPSGGNKKKKDD